MKLKPVNDKIVVKENEKNKEERTAGGIILPDTVQDGALVEGEVVAIGEGMYSASGTLIPVICNVGDKILYNKHAQLYEYDDEPPQLELEDCIIDIGCKYTFCEKGYPYGTKGYYEQRHFN